MLSADEVEILAEDDAIELSDEDFELEVEDDQVTQADHFEDDEVTKVERVAETPWWSVPAGLSWWEAARMGLRATDEG